MATGTINIPNGFLMRQRLTSTSDLNDFVGFQYVGFYVATTNVGNCPEDWSTVLVIATAENSMRQIVFSGSSIYMRAYAGSPRAWGNWIKFTGSAV